MSDSLQVFGLSLLKADCYSSSVFLKGRPRSPL